MKKYNRCPHCDCRIGLLRKEFCLSCRTAAECPNCKKKIILRPPDNKSAVIIIALIAVKLIIDFTIKSFDFFRISNFVLIGILFFAKLVLPIEKKPHQEE